MSDRTQEHSTALLYFGDGALTLYGRPFQGRLPMKKKSYIEVLQPPAPFSVAVMILPPTAVVVLFTTEKGAGFGLFPFRSPLLRESLMISFPLLHEMFQFTE